MISNPHIDIDTLIIYYSQHKTMIVWVYDKRPRNGSQFVYFGMLPVDPESEEANILIPYARGVLDALGMAHGISENGSLNVLF